MWCAPALTRLRCVGGSSVQVLPIALCNTVLMDFDSLRDVKSGLGCDDCDATCDRNTTLTRAHAQHGSCDRHEQADGHDSKHRTSVGILRT
jgi:NADH:ubiquinone oxidoreductase subunit F (NADH-binding)